MPSLLLYTSAVVGALAVAIGLMHYFVKSPIDAVEYSLPPPLPFEGFLEVNKALASAELLLEDQIYGPESIAVDKSGKVYTGLKTGLICELDLDGDKPRIVRAVRLTSLEGCDGSYHSFPKCGRPLGMRFNSKGELIVVDAYLGLFAINFEKEEVRQLFAGGAMITDDENQPPIRFLNDFDFMPDGRIVISESSNKFDDRDFLYDMFEHRPNGRLISFNAKTEELSVLAEDLYFPNGVQVFQGEVLFSEMSKARIQRYSFKTGKISTLIDALPGYPDNIRLIGFSLWVPIASLRTEDDNWLAERPKFREFLTKVLSPQALPALLDYVSTKYGLVMKIDPSNGEVLGSLHDDTGRLSDISIAIDDGKGAILFGSDTNTYIGRLRQIRAVKM